ncbi:response regulator [Horticoccus luteus]|uniref:histidine kinase n=1 Tax=Horticoccus luteus TaxID=2862869 RepID=A0A8F9TXT0_9BACT|nr:GAF domain-containing hybrid sensor histidine kinase/response regulator [Horticoccus luteus]QYM79713.1 response regulator [Horticoccus luteus]
MSSSLSPSESARLAVLRSYDVLDTSPEREYDDLVALAAEICDAPLAAISFVDETRQWFKARIGLADTETPRDISFCSHAIAQPGHDLFVVPDAQKDQRFATFANVTGAPHIRFYAGAPLVTPDGSALGSLCVIDRVPRDLSPAQLRALRVLRRHVVNSLELRRLALAQRSTITALERTRTELEAARFAADAATRAKSQFLATMSHEIRTPMNAVIGMATVLSGSPLDADQRECVDTIRTSGELLLSVINDILDFSKIESGHLELERQPFVLAACVRDALEIVALAASRKNLALTYEPAPDLPAALVGDVTRLRQILVNLLNNAIKFTEHGSVTIRSAARPHGTGSVELHLSVQDTGIGIPADQLDRLFRAFSQVDASTARRFGGTGLGLAISKHLAELHGGRMWVESEPGRGSTFHVTLVAPVAASTPAPLAATTFDPTFALRHPARILVADDNIVNQTVACRLLQRLGYSPAVASNGREVVEAVQRESFDLVLMDVEMPVLDGPAATRLIREQLPHSAQPRIVALTAHVLADDRARLLASGMDDFLPKPFRLAQLTAILARGR